MARGRAASATVRVHGPVPGGAASWRRRGRCGRRRRARTDVRDHLFRGHGSNRREDRHHPDCGRLFGDARPPRRDRRHEGRRRRRGRQRRDDRAERRSRGERAIRPPRRPLHVTTGGLRGPALAAARPRGPAGRCRARPPRARDGGVGARRRFSPGGGRAHAHSRGRCDAGRRSSRRHGGSRARAAAGGRAGSHSRGRRDAGRCGSGRAARGGAGASAGGRAADDPRGDGARRCGADGCGNSGTCTGRSVGRTRRARRGARDRRRADRRPAGRAHAACRTRSPGRNAPAIRARNSLSVSPRLACGGRSRPGAARCTCCGRSRDAALEDAHGTDARARYGDAGIGRVAAARVRRRGSGRVRRAAPAQRSVSPRGATYHFDR